MCHALHLATNGPCGSYPRKPDRAITSGLPTTGDWHSRPDLYVYRTQSRRTIRETLQEDG